MKFRNTFFLILLCAFFSMACATAPRPSTFDGAYFPTWFYEQAHWRTAIPAAWKHGIENAPTDEQMAKIMHFATRAVSSGGQNDLLWVLLRDVEAQQDIVAATHAGTVTVLIFADRGLQHSARGRAFEPDRAYVNAGIASGYFNIAAISQGFATRMYLSPEGGWFVNRPFTPAPVATATRPSIESVYLPGLYYTVHGAAFGGTFPAYGNLKFVQAIVVGTIDTNAPMGGVTQTSFPENWVWAPSPHPRLPHVPGTWEVNDPRPLDWADITTPLQDILRAYLD